MQLSNRVVATPGAPAAIGPYSQAILRDGWLFASGQVALDPATGTLVTGGIGQETLRVLENLKAVIEAAGGGLADVVKCTVYLTDMADFPQMNEVYAAFFGEARPARATVAVQALPRGARVEIDAIARIEFTLA